MCAPMNDAIPQRLSLKQWFTLIFVSLVFLIAGQWTIPVMDRDEARYAQASKQMIETGDYIDIRFQKQTRYVKPVLTYWLQSTSARLFGGRDAEIWAYRLPSLLGALLAIIATAWLGAAMGNATVGLWAGLFLGVSMIVSVEARMAKTDALLLAATIVAQAALYHIWKHSLFERLKFIGAPLIFWIAVACGLLIKGPLILLFTMTTIIAFSFWLKSWTWLRNLYPLRGLLLVLLMVAPWVILITIKTDGKFLADSLGHALLGKVVKSDDSHGMPPGYHLVVYFACFWPASILTVLQNVYAFKMRGLDSVKFLLCWLWPNWIVFELVVTKLPHYTLPLYPAIAILTALALFNAKALLQYRFVYRLHMLNVVIFVLFSAVLVLVPSGLLYYFTETISITAILSVVAGLVLIIAGVYFGLMPTGKRLVPVLITTAIFYGFTFGSVLPGNLALWPSKQLSQKIDVKLMCSGKPVAIVGYPEPSGIFYLGTDTVLASAKGAGDLLSQGAVCPIIVVEQKFASPFLLNAKSLDLEVLQIDEVKGLNISKGRTITLNIYKQVNAPSQ